MNGIMFIPDLMPLVLDGSKRQTRRIMKPQPEPGGTVKKTTDEHDGDVFVMTEKSMGLDWHSVAKPRYKPGEVVCIKEPWAACKCLDADEADVIPQGEQVWYQDGPPRVTGCQAWDEDESHGKGRIRDAEDMPAWAARYHLRITDVRAERVRDIDSEKGVADAIAEGCPGNEGQTPIAQFLELVESMGMSPSDWVWVYTFELANGGAE